MTPDPNYRPSDDIGADVGGAARPLTLEMVEAALDALERDLGDDGFIMIGRGIVAKLTEGAVDRTLVVPVSFVRDPDEVDV